MKIAYRNSSEKPESESNGIRESCAAVKAGK
jgi:hypothetical protein